MDKSKLWFFLLIAASLLVSIAFIGGCTRQSSTEEPLSPAPSPPTEPVTPGYIQSYDYKLGYGLEYPKDWEMQIPEVVDGEDVESIAMFTKPGTSTTLIVTVKLSRVKSQNSHQNMREWWHGTDKEMPAMR